jgi:DNA modification methylase
MQTISVEYRSTTSLVSYVRKLRKHDHAVPKMAALLTEFGFKIPVLIRSTGEIVDGHLRVKAASTIGLTEVPVIVCDEWTEAQVKAFRLAVNRSASWAEWDMELVAIELTELKAMDFDLSLTAFDASEMDRCFGTDNHSDEITVSEATPITKPGDLWICGDHRVLCGDSTSFDAVTRLLNGSWPVLMVTDPPYGILLDPNWRERAGLGTIRQTGTVANDDRVDWTEAYKLFPGDVAYIWHAGIHAAEVARNIEAAGFKIRSQIIWAKQHFALSRGDYHWKHEPCWYAVREGKSSNWYGDRKQSTLWEVANLNPFGGGSNEEATGHGTQKPEELMRRAILNNSQRGEGVYDPFLGSGTTLVAAESNGRVCYGIDVDARYVDCAVLRWQKLTGKQAVLDADGRSFDQISAERRVKEDVHAAS